MFLPFSESLWKAYNIYLYFRVVWIDFTRNCIFPSIDHARLRHICKEIKEGQATTIYSEKSHSSLKTQQMNLKSKFASKKGKRQCL